MTFVELWVEVLAPPLGVWTERDLTIMGVPPEAVACEIIAHRERLAPGPGGKVTQGVRAKGSGLERRLAAEVAPSPNSGATTTFMARGPVVEIFLQRTTPNITARFFLSGYFLGV